MIKCRIIAICFLFSSLALWASAQEKEQAFIDEAGLGNVEIRLLIKENTGAIWIGTDDDGIIRYDGSSWIRYTEEDGLPRSQARYGAFDQDNVLWVGSSLGATSFDGKSWTSYLPENSGLSGKTVRDVAVDADNVKWFATSELNRFDGVTWETVYTPSETQMRVSAIAFDHEGIMWVGTGNGVVSYDGESWNDYPPEDSEVGPMSVLSIACDQKNVIWFAGYGGIVRFDGSSWKRYDRFYDPDRDKIVDVGACYTVFIDDDNTAYFGRGGLYYDEANDTIERNTNLSAGSNTLLHDRGIWWLGNRSGLFIFADENPTGVGEHDSNIEFLSVQSYPNPFNSQATIDFTLAWNGFTVLSVYSLGGQKVRELVSGYMTAGKYSVVWNGLNSLGMPVSSGVYITRFTNGNHVATGRMTFIK